MKDYDLSHIRSRTKRPEHESMYGEYARQMKKRKKFFHDMVDRAAYVYVTGCFPSHLRKPNTDALRQMTRDFKKPSSLDGRSGYVVLNDGVVQDMQLERHPMVLAVRQKLRLGYFIQVSRGYNTRRSFEKIFMYKLDLEGQMSDQVTINSRGFEKAGWFVKPNS